nr:MAG TPA: hypothetical protein [Bacteriophage sp.]
MNLFNLYLILREEKIILTFISYIVSLEKDTIH